MSVLFFFFFLMSCISCYRFFTLKIYIWLWTKQIWYKISLIIKMLQVDGLMTIFYVSTLYWCHDNIQGYKLHLQEVGSLMNMLALLFPRLWSSICYSRFFTITILTKETKPTCIRACIKKQTGINYGPNLKTTNTTDEGNSGLERWRKNS